MYICVYMYIYVYMCACACICICKYMKIHHAQIGGQVVYLGPTQISCTFFPDWVFMQQVFSGLLIVNYSCSINDGK